MIKSLAEQEIEYLAKAWELHLSGFVSPIAFIGCQRPPHYYPEYKFSLFVAAVDNEALIGDFDVVECFIVGC